MLQFLIEKYLLFILFRYKKRSCMKKINVIVINMKTSDITWKIVILQKIRKKNQWIWSYYDRETLVSNFNCRLKRKNDGGNELTVRHVVPAKQLDQSNAATWSQSSSGRYMKCLLPFQITNISLA
jgi:hypothetical protein